MKRLAFAAILAVPAVASAHPGHEHYGVTNHSLGEWAIFAALAAISVRAILWLRSRHED